MSQCHEKVRTQPDVFFFVKLFKMMILVYTTMYEPAFYVFKSMYGRYDNPMP